jgi:M6 family metalloprotease-like protein
MRTISSAILTLSILLLSISTAHAVTAYPFPIKITQPDGTELTIRLRGDEHFNYKTTLDGYALTQNQQGILTYAKVDETGNLTSTEIKANNIERRSASERKFIKNLTPNINFNRQNALKRALRAPAATSEGSPQKTYPLTGSPKSLVILVNFSDKKFVTPSPQTAFTNMLNQNGYSDNNGTRSARDYFRDNSMGAFDPEFDVVGPYTLPQSLDFYGKNDTGGSDTNPRQMVIDACALASANNVDFSKYDTDKDGIVDNVFIYYAGYNEAEGGPANTIWPHRWSLSNTSTKFNGVSVYGYACTSELRSHLGSIMCGVGTFVHEFGHVLGLPDYYNTDDQTKYTLSYWSVMDEGPYLNEGNTPPCYSAYDRFYLGWLKPIEIKETGDFILDTLSTSNKAYLFTQYGNHNLNGSSPSPAEFFTLENRQKKGWDAYLPGHGMLVTHIYYNATTWAENTTNNTANAMGVDIVEADNNGSTSTLPSDPYPGTYNVTSYNPTLRSGTDIRKPISNIKETNGKITFSFGTKITVSGSFQAFSTVQGTPSAVQSIVVAGSKLKTDLVMGFGTGLHFQLKKQSDPETAWSKSISITPTDSSITSTIIQIRYNPTVPSYTSTHSETLSFISGADAGASQVLTGTSTRPVYVVPPVATAPTSLSFYGFTANWNSVFDATGYYITVFNISNGESSLFEGFDNGLTPTTGWTITTKNTSTYTLYSGTKVPSIQFSNTGEYVETEKYQIPASELSFYLRSLGGSNGGFIVEGMDEQNKWNKIDSIPVTSALYEKSKSYTFDSTKAYIRFRFRYSKDIGSLTFDDVTVKFNKQLGYVERNKWVTTNSETLSGLQPNTEYIYKIKASDKNTIYNYENITDFSNTIKFNTADYPIQKGLLVTKDDEGNITAYLPTTTYKLYIYNLLGQCIRVINPESNTVTITDLPRPQVYILKANDRTTKIILTGKNK